MKLISAIIKPFKLEDVRLALSRLGRITTATEVKTHSPQRAGAETYRGSEHAAGFIPKIKVEVVVPDDELETALEIVRRAAVTGHMGDGRIFVWSVERAVRISTGETDESVL
jgi:nitrogen regulatory protein P-II 2